MVVSGYMGSAGTRAHVDQSSFTAMDPFSAASLKDPFASASMNGEETRRNDVRVQADINDYFKSVPKSLRKKLLSSGGSDMINGRSLFNNNHHNNLHHGKQSVTEIGGTFLPRTAGYKPLNYLTSFPNPEEKIKKSSSATSMSSSANGSGNDSESNQTGSSDSEDGSELSTTTSYVPSLLEKLY